MKAKQIKRFLKSLNISVSDAEAGVRIPQLRSIISDKSQGILYHEDVVTFDFDNELVRIKKYTYKAVNGLFNVLNGKNKELALMNNSNLQRTLKAFPYRKPRIGDKVYEIQNGNPILLGNIVDITSFKITLDRNINSKIYENLIYVDPNIDINNAVPDYAIVGLYINYKPITKYVTDIYLDFDGIVGFSAFSSTTGFVGRI